MMFLISCSSQVTYKGLRSVSLTVDFQIIYTCQKTEKKCKIYEKKTIIHGIPEDVLSFFPSLSTGVILIFEHSIFKCLV